MDHVVGCVVFKEKGLGRPAIVSDSLVSVKTQPPSEILSTAKQVILSEGAQTTAQG